WICSPLPERQLPGAAKEAVLRTVIGAEPWDIPIYTNASAAVRMRFHSRVQVRASSDLIESAEQAREGFYQLLFPDRVAWLTPAHAVVHVSTMHHAPNGDITSE